MDGIFAGTPPLEALRALVHEAATIGHGYNPHTKVVMVNDVSKAFFEEMAKWTFKRGKYNPCLYIRPSDDVLATVHGDAFVSVGSHEATRRFKSEFEGRFGIKTQVIGSRAGV